MPIELEQKIDKYFEKNSEFKKYIEQISKMLWHNPYIMIEALESKKKYIISIYESLLKNSEITNNIFNDMKKYNEWLPKLQPLNKIFDSFDKNTQSLVNKNISLTEKQMSEFRKDIIIAIAGGLNNITMIQEFEECKRIENNKYVDALKITLKNPTKLIIYRDYYYNLLRYLYINNINNINNMNKEWNTMFDTKFRTWSFRNNYMLTYKDYDPDNHEEIIFQVNIDFPYNKQSSKL